MSSALKCIDGDDLTEPFVQKLTTQEECLYCSAHKYAPGFRWQCHKEANVEVQIPAIKFTKGEVCIEGKAFMLNYSSKEGLDLIKTKAEQITSFYQMLSEDYTLE